ncbi:DUF3253 domain-containing protein [Granulosicoccus sp.]|nr:DUF3253 domain-containing protein [Granulosicoccus sp.]
MSLIEAQYGFQRGISDLAAENEYREGYQKIKGRWWRSSDPRIPASLRQELVNELMSARRAVASGKKAGCDDAITAARFRVNNAKCALGERGHKWWLKTNTNELKMRIIMTLCVLLHHRTQGSVCPSEVARIAAGDEWRDYMSTVRELAQYLVIQGIADITQKGKSVKPPFSGPIRIRRGARFGSTTQELLRSTLAE